MKRFLIASFIIVISTSLFLTGCGSRIGPKVNNSDQASTKNVTSEQTSSLDTSKTQDTEKTATDKPNVEIDLAKVKPNEAGKVFVVMLHRFVESFTPTKSDPGQYVNTFDAFKNFLQEVYDKGYRLVNMNDYLNNNIDVPAGCIPMVFTFDDGSDGQFNLIEENGKLVANKQSAVGIMEEFNKLHPDFGLKGTFYVNLGGGTFEGKGTLTEKLKYLIDEGFEIGNHTYNHVDFNSVKTGDKVQQEVGENQKMIEELIPGYKMTTLALPLGHTTSSDLKGFIAKGEYEGVKYENAGLMLVGAEAAPVPVSTKFKPLAIPRVRYTGMKAEDCDLNYWLKNLSRSEQYVSDGNPDTITIPKAKEEIIDKSKLGNRKLITY
jgi:peptidoglycan/xylan/chitin deacetylase (PgdA/CDA1 family)